MQSKNHPSIRIFPASEMDIPWILEVEREDFSPPWTQDSLLSEIHNEDSYFSIAQFDGCNLGFVILRRLVDSGELLQIAAHKSARRRGVASALLSAAIEDAAEKGITSVFLEVRKSNDAAISLYLKHGFRPIRQRKDYYTDPIEDATEMVWVTSA